jgi:uncharacterized protein
MAKAPVPGQVKTRLAPPLTAVEACEFYRCLLADQLDHLESFRSADLFLAFTPEESASFFAETTPSSFTCVAQRGDGLGERMNHVFMELSRRRYKRIVLMGSDVLPIPIWLLESAYSALDNKRDRVVLGPAQDGGYYLIGLNKPAPRLFRKVVWSREDALERTMGLAAEMNMDSMLLVRWFDIDTPADLRALAVADDSFLAGTMQRTLSWLTQSAIAAKLQTRSGSA